jgi:hypothetical protein
MLPRLVHLRHEFCNLEDKKNMLSRFKRLSSWIMLAFCCVILSQLLVACGGGTTSTLPPTPRPSPTLPPTPTPSLTVYTGNGYSIGYPQGWKATPGDNRVTFTDPTQVYNLAIVASPNPNGVASAETVASASISAVKATLTNPQTETLPPTTTVGGESWVQKSLSGTGTSNGQSVDIQIVVISDNHPANSTSTQNFTMVYGAPKALFATADTSYFQLMLQSFKFTS